MSRAARGSARGAILDAARRMLEEQGSLPVLERIAADAGVSRQAVYLQFGSRAGLLIALIEQVDAELHLPALLEDRVWGALDSVAALAGWIEVNAKVIPRILALSNVLDAARRSDPDVEVAWQVPMGGRLADCTRLVRWLQTEGKLAPGWTTSDAADLLWQLSSPRTYDDLAVARGWGNRRYIRHLTRVVQSLLVKKEEPD